MHLRLVLARRHDQWSQIFDPALLPLDDEELAAERGDEVLSFGLPPEFERALR